MRSVISFCLSCFQTSSCIIILTNHGRICMCLDTFVSHNFSLEVWLGVLWLHLPGISYMTSAASSLESPTLFFKSTIPTPFIQDLKHMKNKLGTPLLSPHQIFKFPIHRIYIQIGWQMSDFPHAIQIPPNALPESWNKAQHNTLRNS